MTSSALKTLCPALLLLAASGCAPNHYLIERSDVSGMEQQLDHLDARITELEEQQAGAFERLSLENRFANAALMQTMVAEIGKRSCAADCLGARDDDDTRDEQRVTRVTRPPVVQVGGKQVVGGIEQVLLSPPGILFEARIDTGAESASLDARDIQEFERDGNRWVRFSIEDRETGEQFEIERRVVKYVRVLQSVASEPERRPIVEFRLTLGGITQSAEFTLTDRAHLTLPVLIGRNVLQDVMVVDVGRDHIAPPKIPLPERAD